MINKYKTQLNRIKECVASIATMMDTLPNPAIAVVGIKDEKKVKRNTAKAERGKEHELQEKK